MDGDGEEDGSVKLHISAGLRDRGAVPRKLERDGVGCALPVEAPPQASTLLFLFNQQRTFIGSFWVSSDFFNWNKVKIRYCDGASFAGHPESEFKASPVDVFQLELFFRGQLIWETLMDELLSIGLSNARQVKKRTETRRPPKEVQMEYMSLLASQYSVLDAGSIERVDNSTFSCYIYNFKFFAFEVCPVLLVRVEEEPNGFCIKLLSCKLEGSPIVVAQNEKIDASMVNRVSCNRKQSDSSVDVLTSDIAIEVSIEIPFAFQPIPVQAIESTDTQVLEQILRIMLPCFMAQTNIQHMYDISFLLIERVIFGKIGPSFELGFEAQNAED
ncbi:hypothetical protein TEA_007755 [Camellia sinensis var. sinensis]|uniref:Pectin acetylesterase n=1 Tax=Camellia sinensis var. sinensis TaxID=542762 RepID=A0A4V3WMA5_CAMSN|nr:hypothetical protein TEA_007755 [Camellia sinensis var. sinensis]